MNKLKQGFVQIYTGNGKGKSTAAIGQAVRAAGFGLKTYIAQFMKEYPYNELISLKHLSEWILIEQFGGDEFVYKKEPPGRRNLPKLKGD
jgi:cob(I)alamin adenosyltransferase